MEIEANKSQNQANWLTSQSIHFSHSPFSWFQASGLLIPLFALMRMRENVKGRQESWKRNERERHIAWWWSLSCSVLESPAKNLCHRQQGNEGKVTSKTTTKDVKSRRPRTYTSLGGQEKLLIMHINRIRMDKERKRLFVLCFKET